MKKRNSMKKIGICLASAVVLLTASLLFILFQVLLPVYTYKSFASDDIVIIEDKSAFERFSVTDGSVRLLCQYTITNNSDHTVYFELVANMEDDQKGGLLTQSKLIGYGIDSNTYNADMSEADADSFDPTDEAQQILIGNGDQVLELAAHKTQEFYVVYTGGFGGNAQKQNRLLPSTSLIEVYP